MERKISKKWDGKSLEITIDKGDDRWQFVAFAKDAKGERWETMGFYSNEEDEWNLDSWRNHDISAIEVGELADRFEKEVGK